MSKQSCKIILDSLMNNERITTIQIAIWRPLWHELLQYRQGIARNSASSRAIPVDIHLNTVANDPFIPTFIGKEHKGMSPTEFLTGDEYSSATELIKLHATQTVSFCRQGKELGMAKSILNRHLEPFLLHNALITATAKTWQWIFTQRCHPAAEPNLRELVELIRDAYDTSIPTQRAVHMPYIEGDDGNPIPVLAKCSAARCARLSYTPFGEPKKSMEADLALADKLQIGGHHSPYEHILVVPEQKELLGQRALWVSEANAVSKSLFTLRQLMGE
jgi:hypothetical protein